MTTIDWAAAHAAGQANATQDIVNAAGRLTHALDRLAADPNVAPEGVVFTIDLVTGLVNDRSRLQAALSGQPVNPNGGGSAPLAVGGGSPTNPSPQPDPNAALVASFSSAIITFVQANGGQVKYVANTPGQIDVAASLDTVKSDFDAKLASATSAPADSVKKSDLKAPIEALEAALAKGRKSHVGSDHVFSKTDWDNTTTQLAAVSALKP